MTALRKSGKGGKLASLSASAPAPSIRELALRAVVAALSVSGTPATGGVFRSRLDRLTQAELPCFDITPGEERQVPGEYTDRTSVTRVLPVMVRGVMDAGLQPSLPVQPDDSGLDPFYTFAIQALTGGKANLGGAVLQVEEVGSAAIFQPAGRDLIGLELTFDLTFATRRGDPTQKG